MIIIKAQQLQFLNPGVQVGGESVKSGLPIKFGHAQHQQRNTTLFIRIGSKNRLPGAADYIIIFVKIDDNLF